jgi:hypothetical protein
MKVQEAASVYKCGWRELERDSYARQTIQYSEL